MAQTQCLPLDPLRNVNPRYHLSHPSLDSQPAASGATPPGADRRGKHPPVLSTNIAQLGERRRRLTQPLCGFEALVSTFLSTTLSFPEQPHAVRLAGWLAGQR